MTYYLKNCRLDLYREENAVAVMYFFSAEQVSLTPVKNMSIAVIYPYEWNEFMTPWVFDGDSTHKTGKGKDFMEYVLNEIIPFVEKEIQGEVVRGIGGYSLGGMEALYISTCTGRFVFAGSVSGSLWYPGIAEYLEEHAMQCGSVYLSLGRREHKTGNPLRCQVLDRTELVAAACRSRGMKTSFELNDGGHFTQINQRINRCIEVFFDSLGN